MPPIRIRDELSVEILSANPPPAAGLAKYLKGSAPQLVAGADFAGQARRDLALVTPGDKGFRLTWASDVPLGTDAVALKLTAGTTTGFQVFNRRKMVLFEDAVSLAPVEVAAGQAFVAWSLQPTLAASVASSRGPLTFGLDAGSEAQWRYFHPFDVAASSPTLADACRTVLESFAIPHSVADLKTLAALPVGATASVAGHGRLRVSCSLDVAAALNPLAGLDTLGRLGTLTVGGAATARVGVKAQIVGDFEVRVEVRAPGRVRLSYHKQSARGLDLSLDAAVGGAIAVGDRDLLSMVFGAAGDPAGSSVEALVAAGVSEPQLDRIKKALKAGMSRKVELSLHAGFSSLKVNEAAYCYDIDVAAVDAAGKSAIERALTGDLSELTALDLGVASHGVTLVRSRTEELRTRQVEWRLNVIGLINVISMTELAAKATVVHDAESGEVVITDEVTRRKIGAVTSPGEIRRLLYQSLLLTATYKAGGLDQNVGLGAEQSFFKLDRDVNRHEMADYLDVVAALGLLPADEIDDRLGDIDDFGRGSLSIDVKYPQDACTRMFIDGDGGPRSREAYEAIGKRALALLVQERDADAYRRVPLLDAPLWQRMREAGAPSFHTVLPPPITSGSPDAQRLKVAVVAADYSMIVWWADTMATASSRLAEMRAFLAGPPPIAPSDRDPAFAKKREKLSDAMIEVVRKSPSTFGGDPWGLVALFLAASPDRAAITAAVISSNLQLFHPE